MQYDIDDKGEIFCDVCQKKHHYKYHKMHGTKVDEKDLPDYVKDIRKQKQEEEAAQNFLLLSPPME